MHNNQKNYQENYSKEKIVTVKIRQKKQKLTTINNYIDSLPPTLSVSR